MANDSLTWEATFAVQRWEEDQVRWVKTRTGLMEPKAEDFARLHVDPYSETEVRKNLLTTAGLGRISSLITGGGGQAATNTAARLGAGSGASAAAVGDTDLSASAGAGNRWFQVMDATYPQISGGVMTFKATFGSSDGNFAWNEFGIDIGAPSVVSSAVVSALLLNHKSSIAQGTKAAGQTWSATASISIA